MGREGKKGPVRYPGYRCRKSHIISDHPTSSKGTVHHHHRYRRYRFHFAAFREVRRAPLLIVGGGNAHRRFDHRGLLQKLVHSYRGQPVTLRRLRAIIGRIRTRVQTLKRGRMSDVIVKRCIVSGLTGVSSITCVHFTDICHRFSSQGAFLSRLGGVRGGGTRRTTTRTSSVRPSSTPPRRTTPKGRSGRR